MDGIRATPYRSPIAGTANDILGGLLGYMRDPRRTQQMQGLAGLLESTGIPKTVERLAFGEPLTNIRQANVPVLRPETANALLTLAPVPPATGRATMAVGRAGERLAERVVPQVMERGGMPAGLLEGMSSRTVSPLTVYHGSPAKFERFDPTKIGSGEGAQAYGYGHYVAESPETANYYAKTLANQHGRKLVDKTGKELSFNNPDTEGLAEVYLRGSSGYEDAKKQLQALADSSPEYASEYKKAIEKLNDWESQGIKIGYEKEPNVYTIDLPDEQIARMLDYDKPISKQKNVMLALESIAEKKAKDQVRSEIENNIRQSGVVPSPPVGDDWMNTLFGEQNVKSNEIVKNLVDEQMSKIDFAPMIKIQLDQMKPVDMTWDMSGKQFYELLTKQQGSPEKASEAFRAQGIPGIRYLDQDSRGTGVGTQNFVVFPGNEDLLTILRRNGGLLD